MGRPGCECAKRAMCRGPDSSCHRAMLATSGDSGQPSLAGRHRQQQQHHPDLLERATEQLNVHSMSVPEPDAGSRVESSVTRFNKQQEQQVRGSMSAIELMTTKANNLCLAKRELVRSITMRAIKSQPNFQTEQGRHKSTVNALCSEPQTTKTNSNVLLPQLMLPLVLMMLVAVVTVACVTTVPASASTASRQTVAQLGGNTESVNRVPNSRIEESSLRDKGGQIKRPKWPDEEVVQEQAIAKSRHTARGQGVSHTWRHQRKRRHHIHPSGHQVQRRDRRLSCARRADRGGHHHLLRASENGALKSDSGVVMGHGQAIKDLIKSFERGGENELHLRYIEVESLPDDDELLLLSDKKRLEKINGHDYREARNEPYKLSRSRPLLKPLPPTHLNLTLKDAAHYHNGLQSSKSRRSTMTRGDHKIVKIVEVADLFGAGSTPLSRPETSSPTTNQTVTPIVKLNNDIITNNGNIIHHETQSAASSREEGGESSRESVLVSESESGSFRDVQDSVSSNNDENGNENDDEDGGEGSDDATADDDSSSSDNSTFSTSTGPKACAELENLMSNRPTGSLAISFGLFYTIIFILGLAGNVITMYVLVCKGKKRTAQDILIANLACGDIMICVFAVPVTPKYIILDGRWTMGPILCKAVSFAMSTSVYMSTYSLICIGYIRYQLIVHPWDTPMSKRNALWTCLGTWIFAILVTLPYMLNVHLAPEECEIQFCDEVWEGPFRPIFSALTTVFQFAIPLGSVIFFNWKIKNTLDSRRQELSGGGPGGAQSDKTVAHNNNNIIDSNSNRLAAPGLKRKLHNSVDHLNLFSSAAQNGAHDTPERGGGGATAQRQQLLARAPDVLAIKEQRLRDRDKRTRKANKRLLFVVVVFAHSWLGLNIFNLLQDITDFMTDWPYITKVFVVVHIIACSSVIWNPLLYAWMNETYQQDLRCALPRFVAARFSSLLIEPSTTSGHRSTVADGPGHHHTLPGQQHLHPQQQHSDQRQIVSAQFQGKQQDRVAAAKEATAPIDCTNIRKGSHELFALVANASGDDECHQDNGQLALARGAKAQQVDDCAIDHVDCEQQHQVDTFTIELEPACVGHGAGECCNSLNSIGHLYDCATSGRKSGQSSESVASDELLDACFCRHVEVHEDDDEDEDDENGCGGPAGSCNGCRNGPLQPYGASTTTNGNESTACNNNLASGTCHQRHREPDCRRGEQSGDPTGSAPVQFVNENGATESAARLRHQNSIKASIATSQSGNNNNNNNQGSHQQQSHRRRSQRRTSCSSSIMGENLQIVV